MFVVISVLIVMIACQKQNSLNSPATKVGEKTDSLRKVDSSLHPFNPADTLKKTPPTDSTKKTVPCPPADSSRTGNPGGTSPGTPTNPHDSTVHTPVDSSQRGH